MGSRPIASVWARVMQGVRKAGMDGEVVWSDDVEQTEGRGMLRC